jgi:hypothetical protein
MKEINPVNLVYFIGELAARNIPVTHPAGRRIRTQNTVFPFSRRRLVFPWLISEACNLFTFNVDSCFTKTYNITRPGTPQPKELALSDKVGFVILPDGLGAVRLLFLHGGHQLLFMMFPRDATRRRNPIKYLRTCLKDKADEEFNVDRNVPPGRK